MITSIRRTCVLLAALAIMGCGARAPVVDQLPAETLFERGITALQNRKWDNAIELLERFMIQYPANPRIQEARFRLGEAYFGKKEYITAGNEFSRLANDYPAGPYADDARFKVCESYYQLSPKAQLDQQYTRAAVDHCQSLLTYYATSDFAPRAVELVTELRAKLATKEFLAGEFYFKRNAFDSAIIYFENTVRDYAETEAAPRALLRLYETYRTLGYKDEMEAARQRLIKDYPTSPEATQLQQGSQPGS